MANRLLNARTLRQLQEALAVVAEAPDGLTATAAAAVEQLQRLVPCESAVLGYRRASDGAYFGFWRPFAYPVDRLGEAYHRHVGEHPFVQHYRQHPGAPAVRFSDLVSARQLRQRAIFHEFFAPLGTHQLLGRVVPVADLADWNFGAADGCFRYATNAAVYPYTTVSLAVGRNRRDFSDNEAAAFDLFVRHVTAQFMRELRWELARRQTPAPGAAESVRFDLFSGRATAESVAAVARRHGLTAREQEVLGWLCAGKTNPEIAGILGTSPRTVQSQTQAIFGKLGVETRLAAARMVWDQPVRPAPALS